MARRLNVIEGHLNPKDIYYLNSTSSTLSYSHDSLFYTLPNDKLTKEQRNFYEKNGFLLVKDLVDTSDLKVYKKRFGDICKGQIKIPGLTVMKDIMVRHQDTNEFVVNKIQDFQHDDILFQYCCKPEILDYVQCFIGENIMAMHTMLINKPPDAGNKTSRHPLHQDLHYFPFRPAERIVCAWTAMEAITRQNGCLVAIPGTHHDPLLPHGYPQWEGGVNKMYHGIMELPEQSMDKLVYIEMDPGDTVFFHPLLIHGSGSNQSKRFRKAISCHYASSDLCHYIDVSGTSQEGLANEILELARRRLGDEADNYEIDFSNIWQVRCRLARGKEGNL